MRPVDKKYPVTLAYGVKRSRYKSGKHNGTDFGCPTGTPVYAAVGGKVTSANWGSAFGKHVVIDNDRFADGTAGLWAGYMHLSKVLVKPGQTVVKGQLIGLSGHSGNVTGDHLHFEIQKTLRWNPYGSVNPQKWINA